MVCLLLGASGGIRYLRDWQFFSLIKESERPPFPLGEFPESLGTWRAVEGFGENARAGNCPDRRGQ